MIEGSTYVQEALEEVRVARSVLVGDCLYPGRDIVRDGRTVNTRAILYFDLPYGSPRFLDAFTGYLRTIAPRFAFDSVCGLATQGVPLAFHAAAKIGIPAFYFRKERQSYGTYSHLTGVRSEFRSTLIIDNFRYSGSTINHAARALEDAGIVVAGAVSAVDFETEALCMRPEIPFEAMLTVRGITEYLADSDYFEPELVPFVRSFVHDQTVFHSHSRDYFDFIEALRTVRIRGTT